MRTQWNEACGLSGTPQYVRDVCAAFKDAGLYTALITAAYMTDAALDYVGPVIDALKFDLKAASSEGWAWLSKVKEAAPACAMAVRANRVHGCHVEVVSNIVPKLNDSPEEMASMARWVYENLGPDTPWHVTRFLPDFELSYLPPTPVSTLERGVGLGKAAGLRFVYVGNVQDHIARHTTCPDCGRTVIERSGRAVNLRGVESGRCAACGTDLALVYSPGERTTSTRAV